MRFIYRVGNHGLLAELTAFYVPQLDRESMFQALKTGRTYASTGVKTLLHFLVNGIGPHQGHARIVAVDREVEITVGSHLPVIKTEILRMAKQLGYNADVAYQTRRLASRRLPLTCLN